MTIVLEIREKLKSIYGEYSFAIHMVLKFVLAFAVFYIINRKIGYLEMLNSIFPILFFSLLCSILSVKSTAVIAGIMVLAHSYGLGLEVLGVTAVVMIVLFLFFIRFDETECLGLLLSAIAIELGIPVLVPICFGLKRKASSAFSIGSGTVLYYYVNMLSEKAGVLQHTETADMLNNMKLLVDGIIQNHMMILNTAAMVIAALLVYVIHRISLDYIRQIAIGFGTVVYLTIMVSGGLFMDVDVSVVGLVVGAVVACVIAYVIDFFVLNLDYSRTERMEFEDDEYYYYVKAVPKVTIAKAQREIKTISTEQESLDEFDENQ